MMLVLLAILFLSLSSRVPRSVHLSQINSLTFRNQYTKAQRTDPIHQLTCVGDCDWTPDEVFCRNLGFDHTTNEYQWECEADLPSNIDLLDVRVSCEGYSGPGDQYVLEGSCGLFYTLHEKPENEYTTTTTTEEEVYYEDQYSGRRSQPQKMYQRQTDRDGTEGFFVLSPILILIVAVVILFLLCFFCTGSGSGSTTQHHSPRVVDRSFVQPSAPPPTNPSYTSGTTYSSGPSYSTPHHHHHTSGTTHHHHHHGSRSSGFTRGLVTGMHLGNAASRGSSRRYPVHHQAPRQTNISTQPRRKVVRKTTTTTTNRPTSSSSGLSRRKAVGGTSTSRSTSSRSTSSRSSRSSGTTRKSKTGGTNSR